MYRKSGTTPVILHINGSARLKLPVGVDLSSGLTEALKTLVGEDRVTIGS
ncbi:MAG: hypothetical protein HYW81_03565 [Parcubacteria group bacterium]|nr:hypothetical protein [Parcubacteria group bacterium]